MKKKKESNIRDLWDDVKTVWYWHWNRVEPRNKPTHLQSINLQ